jgi:methionine--tRNA ligase beta chain
MMISFDDFKKVDMRVGTVMVAEPVPDADKLLRLEVDFGEEKRRQIVSGIAEYVHPNDLLGRQFVFVVNLEPRIIRGLASNGMLLAVGDGESFSMIVPTKKIIPGSSVR